MPQIVCGCLAAPDGFAESFECDIESDLVSILETVGNGLPGDDPKAVAEKLGFHSFEQVIRIIQTGLIETVGSHPRTVEVKERVRLLIEILPHLHAKPQAPIEVTGRDGGPIAHAHVDIMALMSNPELAKAAETLSLAMNPIPVARLKAMQDQETAVRRGLRVVED